MTAKKRRVVIRQAEDMGPNLILREDGPSFAELGRREEERVQAILKEDRREAAEKRVGRVNSGPTPERRHRDEFRTAGAAVRKTPPIDRLVASGQINAVQYQDALRWRQEFEKAYAGYIDHASDYVSPEDGRHDPMTWRIMCMDSGVWLGKIRDKIGKRADTLLVWLLIGEMSFVDIGRRLRPDISTAKAGEYSNVLCVAALERLSEVMCDMRKAAAAARRDKVEHDERMEKWRSEHAERKCLKTSREHAKEYVV